MNRDRLIDGYRGIAVLMVVVGHLFGHHLPMSAHVVRLADALASIGVQIFFAISGYIITSLLLREEAKRGSISITSFYIRRAFRILPPLWCYYAVIILCRSMGMLDTSLPGSALFTCNTGLTDCNWWVGHTWSLAVEEQYYLVWPLLFTLVPARWRTAFLVATLCALVGLYLVLPFHPVTNEIYFASIVAGALYATRPIDFRSWPIWIGACGLMLVAQLYPQWKLLAVSPALAVFIIFASRDLPVRRMVESVSAVGLCSYSLYLWQQLFLGPQTVLPIALLPLAVGASYFLVEKPFQRIGHRLSSGLSGSYIQGDKPRCAAYK